MAYNLEQLAKRLQQLIADAQNEDSGQLPSGMTGRPGPVKPVIEECLGELTAAERDELDRIIEKMRRALASPPGAIAPP